MCPCQCRTVGNRLGGVAQEGVEAGVLLHPGIAGSEARPQQHLRQHTFYTETLVSNDLFLKWLTCSLSIMADSVDVSHLAKETLQANSTRKSVLGSNRRDASRNILS